MRVFSEVARVIRRGGLYRLGTNPFIHDGRWESSWTGSGYLLDSPYSDGEVPARRAWRFVGHDGIERQMPGPKEFRHTLGRLINGLVASGLDVRGFWEDVGDDPHAPPGSWKHYKTICAPWITILAEKYGG